MEKFFELTAWTMTPPATFGTFHILWLVFGLGGSVLLAWLLRKSSEKQNKIIFLVMGIFLIITEIYKQLFYYYIIGGNTLWIFPFQLCSVPMYMCFFVPFIKNKKVQTAFYAFLMIFNLFGGFISLIEISGLVHTYWTLTIHEIGRASCRERV